MKKKSLKILSCLIGGTMIIGAGPKSFAMNPAPTEATKGVVSKLMEQYLGAQLYMTMFNQSYEFLRYRAPEIYKKFAHLIPKGSVFNTNFREVNDKFKEVFQNEIKGQCAAEKEVEGYVRNFLEYIVKKDKSLLKNGDHCGHVLYLIGESGTGKSKCADSIANIILKNSSYVKTVDASSVDSKHKESLKSQLFNISDEILYGYNGVSGPKVKTNNLGDFIFSHPKSVVIINEYDKFFDKDMDEVLRTIVDSGKINMSSGAYLDCDEVLFIITSNESKESFPSLFPNSKNEEKNSKCEISEKNDQEIEKGDSSVQTPNSQSIEKNSKCEINEKNEQEEVQENIKMEKSSPEEDKENPEQNIHGTTEKNHDVSFANRLVVVPFERLNKTSMKEVAKNFFEEATKFYKEHFQINITFDDELLEKVSNYAQDSPQGARAIVKNLDHPLSYAVNEIDSKGNSGSFKLEFLQSEERPKFKLTRVYEQNDISKVIKSAEEFLKDKNKLDSFRDYVLEGDEEVTVDFKSYLSQEEIGELKTCIETLKKVKSEKDFYQKSGKESLEKIQSLMSDAHSRYNKTVKAEEESSPWWSRAFNWVGDIAKRFQLQGK